MASRQRLQRWMICAGCSDWLSVILMQGPRLQSLLFSGSLRVAEGGGAQALQMRLISAWPQPTAAPRVARPHSAAPASWLRYWCQTTSRLACVSPPFRWLSRVPDGLPDSPAAVGPDCPALAGLGSASSCASSRSASAATATRQDGRPGRTVTGPDPSKELGMSCEMGVRRPAWWWYLKECENGHEWAPGRVLVGWVRCQLRPGPRRSPGAGGLGSPQRGLPGSRVPVGVVLTPARAGHTAGKYSLTGSASATVTS